LAELPPAFAGFTILHISGLHADMNEFAMGNLIPLVKDMLSDGLDSSASFCRRNVVTLSTPAL
jgi:hypothetical protein